MRERTSESSILAVRGRKAGHERVEILSVQRVSDPSDALPLALGQLGVAVDGIRTNAANLYIACIAQQGIGERDVVRYRAADGRRALTRYGRAYLIGAWIQTLCISFFERGLQFNGTPRCLLRACPGGAIIPPCVKLVQFVLRPAMRCSKASYGGLDAGR